MSQYDDDPERLGDECDNCGKTFAECDCEDVYCHACSKAGGASMPVYHLAPACPDDEEAANEPPKQ